MLEKVIEAVVSTFIVLIGPVALTLIFNLETLLAYLKTLAEH